MDIGSDIPARIIAAAEQLYEADSERFPTVDQVRRAARADMNSTSTVMKEWRRRQTAAPAVVVVAIPERISEAMNAALATVWTEAQELANESLAAAQQAWENERLEADAMRSELAEAYELQAAELEASQQTLSQTNNELENVTQRLTEQGAELAEVTAQRLEVERRERGALERLEELRTELAQAKSFADQQVAAHREELAALREKSEQQAQADQAALETMRQQVEQQRADHAEKLAAAHAQHAKLEQELTTVTVRAEEKEQAARSQHAGAAAQLEKQAQALQAAQQEAAQSRETAAELRGKLDAMAQHNKELMAAISQPGRSAQQKK